MRQQQVAPSARAAFPIEERKVAKTEVLVGKLVEEDFIPS